MRWRPLFSDASLDHPAGGASDPALRPTKGQAAPLVSAQGVRLAFARSRRRTGAPRGTGAWARDAARIVRVCIWSGVGAGQAKQDRQCTAAGRRPGCGPEHGATTSRDARSPSTRYFPVSLSSKRTGRGVRGRRWKLAPTRVNANAKCPDAQSRGSRSLSGA